MPKTFTTVIILGPSHYADFDGISIAAVDGYQTPLGVARYNAGIVSALRKNPLVHSVPQADGPEHSVEVQIPFIQTVLPNATIVPIVTGRVDPAAVANLLIPYINEQTLVIASTDLSHYLSQKKARAEDDLTVQTILSGIKHTPLDACGETPIHIVMNIAHTLGLEPVLIDKRTSFETAPQHSGPDKVVGYASIVYVKKSSGQSRTEIPLEIQSYILRLARTSLDAAVQGEKLLQPDDLPDELKKKSGCFVTLTIGGQLRGCIGYIEPIMPLCKAIMDNARSAALRDPRFIPVTKEELSKIKVEVSVLTAPEPVSYTDPDDLLSKLVPNVDGIILKKGPHQSTFLPQVWEQLPDKIGFLQQLSLKAGLGADGWKTADVMWYRAIHFEEKETLK